MRFGRRKLKLRGEELVLKFALPPSKDQSSQTPAAFSDPFLHEDFRLLVLFSLFDSYSASAIFRLEDLAKRNLCGQAGLDESSAVSIYF